MRTILVPLWWLEAFYAPGSRDQPWTWDDEDHHLRSVPCPSVEAGVDCPHSDGNPGCYQRHLEAHVAKHGITQPVCLGPDGRVWDGHHRIVAARRLGIDTIPVESD
jgi:hypothetical protein